MPAKKEIELTISETGDVAVEAHGFNDGSCRTATEALEKALGSVTDRKMKRGGACDVKQTIKAGS
jgi:hypothetical protein